MTKKAAVALALAAGVALSACTGSPSSGETVTLHIVGFAVPEQANKAIADEWRKTEAGRNVRFETSYGASGDQSRAVVNGLKADYVHFSVSSDVIRLVDAGLVDESWDDGPNKGIVSSSVVVLAVRPGNPKNIRDWDDLIQPGIEIVTPNPASSGAARWNALAAWGQVIANGGTEEEAAEYLTKLFANVVSLPGSGRDATTSFLSGTGDVLLAYENETILATQNGEELDWVYDAHRESGGGAQRRASEGDGVAGVRAQPDRAAPVRPEGLPARHRRGGHLGRRGGEGPEQPVPGRGVPDHGREGLRELGGAVEEVLRQ
jgi:ABC-type sulfate transport system substrate-binding protein